VNKKVKSV